VPRTRQIVISLGLGEDTVYPVSQSNMPSISSFSLPRASGGTDIDSDMSINTSNNNSSHSQMSNDSHISVPVNEFQIVVVPDAQLFSQSPKLPFTPDEPLDVFDSKAEETETNAVSSQSGSISPTVIHNDVNNFLAQSLSSR
jgi:hypothetical protein